LVGLLAFFSLRKGCISVQVRADIAAPPLHEVGSEAAANLFMLLASQILWQMGKVRIQDGQQRAKCPFIATVRRSGDQDEMSILFLCETGNQLIALMASTSTFCCIRTG